MTIWRSPASLFGWTTRATTLSRGILALAIMGAGLVSLAVASHVRGATAPIEHVRTAPIMKLILPPGPETARPAAATSGTQRSSPALSSGFRFGYLEFEDDANAPPR
jgi:hypothetical protein